MMDAQPTRERCDLNDPREHLAWVFPGLKLSDGAGLMAHPSTFADWSEHFVKAGVVHVDFIRALADENGMIHVDQLPKQQIERHPPRRGADHWLNPTGHWVDVGTPREPELRAPDVSAYTATEQADMLEQMAREGKFDAETIERMGAQGLIRLERLAPPAFQPMPEPVIDTSALDGRE